MITAQIDMAPLIAKLRKIGVATNEPLEKLVQEQMRLTISSTGAVPGLVQVTPPSGEGARGGTAKKRGEAAVRRDIARVYAPAAAAFEKLKDTAGEPIAKAFWKAAQKKDFSKARTILRGAVTDFNHAEVGPFDGGAAHRSARQSSSGRVGERFKVRLVVTDKTALAAYIKKKIALVGTLASGHNRAATSTSARGIPAWVSRHGARFSGISILRTRSSYYITSSNRVPFDRTGAARRARYILGYRSNALKRAWPFVKRHALRTANVRAA